MSTKPSATSEYMSPAKTPPMSTSAKNAGEPTMSLNGAMAIPKRSSVMAHPEVGVEDGRVLADLGGRAVGDLAPVVEDHDAVRDVHDHAHVVLDERDRRAELRVDVEDEAAHDFLLLDVHAGHRLVEQEELGLGGERAPELHALLQPVGQSAGRGLADRLDLQKIDDPLDERAVLDLLTAGRAPVERLQQEASPRFEEPPRHEVVEHAHALEQGHVLEGSGDAEDGDVGRAEVRPVLAVEDDSSLVGVVEAADHVEQGRLASTVGTDDGQDRAAADLDARLAQRDERAEADADPLHLEERPRGGSGHRASCPATTSWILTSARIVPVRPSSYVTFASTSTCPPSPYSASMRAAYFRAMYPRRTLRVRVISSSSGSSSLWRIRNRRTCAPRKTSSAARVAFTRSTSPRISS